MSKLSTATPAPALVDAYLKEIAQAYDVQWLSADEPTGTDSTTTTQGDKVRSMPERLHALAEHRSYY